MKKVFADYDDNKIVYDVVFDYISRVYLKKGRKIEPDIFMLVKEAVEDIIKQNDTSMTYICHTYDTQKTG